VCMRCDYWYVGAGNSSFGISLSLYGQTDMASSFPQQAGWRIWGTAGNHGHSRPSLSHPVRLVLCVVVGSSHKWGYHRLWLT
jgi:hypothetical protein